MCSLYMKSQNFLSYIPVMKQKTIFSVVCDQYQNKKLNIEKKKTVESQYIPLLHWICKYHTIEILSSYFGKLNSDSDEIKMI